MRVWSYGLKVRSYPNKLVESEMEEVKFVKNGIVVRQQHPRKGITFVLMYHPLFKSMGKKFNKILILLYMDNEVKKVYP